MSALDVVILRRRPTTAAAIGTLIGHLVVIPLLSGLSLMLLVPLASVTLSTPDLHPGYLPCVAVMFLTRTVIAGLTKGRPSPDLTAKP